MVLFRVQKALAGARYPARKADLVDRARRAVADEEVMLALLLLPDRTYESPIAVAVEIARESAARRRGQ